MSNPAFGNPIKQETLDKLFLTDPGEDLVPKTLMQMASIPQFVKLFGPYKQSNNQQRWAGYQRMDWSIRQLPTINCFESQTEDKTSDNAWLNGNITFQVFWPPSLRREDLHDVPVAFKGIMQNFFASKAVKDMLDEIYYIQRPMKVYGLNEFGKMMTWNPNVEGIVESEMVPVTILDVRYRIDLRAWYRALTFMDRTKLNPFEKTLSNLTIIGGEYAGVTDTVGKDISIEISDEINVTNP